MLQSVAVVGRWVSVIVLGLFLLRYGVPISLALWFHVIDPFIVGRIVRRRVYYDLPDGNDGWVSFTSNDFWFLYRQGWVGSGGGGRWYFTMGCTLESAREALAKNAAHRAEERRKAYERRPRWSWDRASYPIFKEVHNFTDKTFKMFQWLAVAVVVRYVAVKTQDNILFILGYVLVFLAVMPYFILLYEFCNVRFKVTPESSGKWMAIYMLLIMICVTVAFFVAADVVQRLVDALYKAQPR